MDKPQKSDSVEQSEETLKKRNAEKSLSIMDYYQHDVFSHLETDARRISQYSLLHKESSLDGKAGDRLSKEVPGSPNQPASLDASLESLSKMTNGSPAETGKTAESCCKVSRSSRASSFTGRPGADPAGSLSDSLYDSFSSCTSQGSNDV
ncbi:hypothetical protein OJAV_G00014680 [Oryzias javanicus]|uniref:Nck-associated protein 5 C-terminal domain-containing protein n=1 Tax=Oryzias javanicus TaxID=123683 RepID=A0A437DJS9_ORYJA|nr:hypothetical protein OJAV_G00014680 [Oryzias javanicus]